jgi:hypothetical protein
LNLEGCIPPFPCNPKIRVRKGASMASEISENSAERMLSEKYPITSFGYFFIYEKMIRRLFICVLYVFSELAPKVTNFTSIK